LKGIRGQKIKNPRDPDTLWLQKEVGLLPSLQSRTRDQACGLDQEAFVGSKKKNPIDEVHWV
jgi:hypothetical protein